MGVASDQETRLTADAAKRGAHYDGFCQNSREDRSSSGPCGIDQSSNRS